MIKVASLSHGCYETISSHTTTDELSFTASTAKADQVIASASEAQAADQRHEDRCIDGWTGLKQGAAPQEASRPERSDEYTNKSLFRIIVHRLLPFLPP